MGGSSSKSNRRRSNPGPLSKEDLSVVETSTTSKSALVDPGGKGNRGKNKKAKKNNVKIDKAATKRKADKGSKRSRSGSSQVVNSIIYVENTCSSQQQVYRKKSSCPSCDARELQKAGTRERSGSEKSLRYSDFNRVQRKTKVYEWELGPVDIPLHGVAEPTPEDTCYVCGVYTGRLLRTCRVCFRSFHDGCLAKIGHGLTDAARALLESNLWSCHQCVSLNHLLTQEEVKSAMATFGQLGLNREAINENQYLKYCRASVQQMGGVQFSEDIRQACLGRFRLVDRTNAGSITWTQFLNLESTRILQYRCKDSLVRLLTQAELAETRRMFQKFDLEKTGFTTKGNIRILIKSTDRDGGSGYYPDDVPMYGHDDPESLVSWGEFLRDRVIYILAQRPNLRQPGNNEDDVIEDGAMTPSFESIDDNEELLPHGDKGSHTGDDRRKESQVQNSRKSSHKGSSIDQLSSLDISTSILDDLTTELDKRCSQNAEEARNKGAENTPGSSTMVQNNGVENAPGSSIPAQDCEKVKVETDVNPLQSMALPNLQNTTDQESQQAPTPRRRSGVTTITSSYRKSEVMHRDDPFEVKDETKSDRQPRCKSMQVAPAYGGLVGKNLRHAEWSC